MTSGAPVCPLCGCLDIYDLTTHRRFKCAACHRQFSVTSGTIFASRKLSFVDLLGAICLFVNASKGLSAVQLSRDLDVQHKTAFVLMHKLREAMTAETRETRLEGEVEADGAAFGGHVRSANLRDKRVDRRLLGNRSGKRRVVVVLRQRGERTVTRTFLRETQGVEFARERIAICVDDDGRDGILLKLHERLEPPLAKDEFIFGKAASSVRRATGAAFLQAGAQCVPYYEVDQVPSAAALACAGLGITSLPELSFALFRHDGLTAIPLIMPDAERQIGIVTRKGRALSPSATVFLNMCRDIFAIRD